jgi:hypothetical protein
MAGFGGGGGSRLPRRPGSVTGSFSPNRGSRSSGGGGGGGGGGPVAAAAAPARAAGPAPRQSYAAPPPRPAAAAPAAPPPARTANYAQYDPRLERHAGRVESAYEDFGKGTKRAIELAAGARRDLGYGQRKAGEQRAAAQGVLGTSSIPDFQARQIDQDVGRDVAGISAGIATGRERDKEQFLLASTGALGAPGEAARADRAGARADQAMEYDRWRVMEESRRAQEAANLQQWMTEMNFAMSFA